VEVNRISFVTANLNRASRSGYAVFPTCIFPVCAYPTRW
jgi:hypothetical protein